METFQEVQGSTTSNKALSKVYPFWYKISLFHCSTGTFPCSTRVEWGWIFKPFPRNDFLSFMMFMTNLTPSEPFQIYVLTKTYNCVQVWNASPLKNVLRKWCFEDFPNINNMLIDACKRLRTRLLSRFCAQFFEYWTLSFELRQGRLKSPLVDRK